ncbi:MAG: hypothetical protein U0838_11290 [Chloroflexota bacterium]
MTSLDPGGVLDDVAAEAARLLGPSGAMIGLLRRRSAAATASALSGSSARLAAWRERVGDEAAHTAVVERRTVVGEGPGAVRSWAVAPLIGEAQVFGALAVPHTLAGSLWPE